MQIKIKEYSFQVEPNKHQAYWDYINSGKWESDSFTTIDQYLKEGNVALDIGAWAGPISFYLAQKAKEVYALEPDLAIYSDLEKNCKLNPQLKVNPFPIAISNESKKQVLFARKKYGQSSSSLLQRSNDQMGSETVQTIRLKEFIELENIQVVDFIKVDTEGGEFLFLKEWRPILKALNFPTLLISFHVKQLKENLAYAFFKSKFIAKGVLKIAKILSIPVFEKQTLAALQLIFLSLCDYQHMYSLQGISLNSKDIFKDSKKVGNNCFVFSNTEWK